MLDLEHLQVTYINNLDRMFKSDTFQIIASHASNIQGYSFINRLLIFMQNMYSTEVRSEESWLADGYIIKPNSTPLGIITPVTDTKYFNSDTGEEIGSTELSANEFNKAVKLGIVNKEVSIKELKCTLVYDSSNVELSENIEDKHKKNMDRHRVLKMSALYELISSMGINISKNDDEESSFDNTNNTLTIGKDNIRNKIECCMQALAYFAISSVGESIELTEMEIKLVVDYSVHAVMTFFNQEYNKDYKYIDDVYSAAKLSEGKIDTLIEILDYIENILNTQVFVSSQDTNALNFNEEHKTIIMKRASILLGILEANYELFRLKGV